MDNINDRHRAFENKYMHDQELRFKKTALAVFELARWALKKMPNRMESSEHYAQSLLNDVFPQKGQRGVVKAVCQDIENDGAVMDIDTVEGKLNELITSIQLPSEQ